MAGDEVRFPAPEVERHAGSVDRIAESVVQARAAVNEVTMDNEAYGQLCQFLPVLLNPVFSQAVSAMNDATDALRETADNLRAAAASVTATDARVDERITGAGAPLLDLPL
ncbi:type VII secretion target [Actinoplanes sp. NPDC051494]|uniref:type VII secretion target n=1 Tax=Actinoplanes sp. NPDC051494 TaxID=3363907 RepID=UPI0037A53229